MSGLATVLADASLVVTCGPGGVGKTTTAAAIALAASAGGRRTIVVTVDPARRLADTLGIDPERADDPHRVPHAGELWAQMLDAQATFDRMITDRTADPERAASILANPVYRSISGSLAGAQEYMAIERLHQLSTSGEWDLIVIDTPPSRHAIDLLGAPDRLVRFLGHPVYRALTAPSRRAARLTNAGASAFLWAIRRLAGPQIVEDTVEFFRAIADIEAGLRERAAETAAELRSERSAFVLVSSPRAEAVDEAVALADALRDGGYPLAATVVNLVHPTPAPIESLGDVPDGALADQLAFHRDLSGLAAAETTELAALAFRGAPLVRIPVLPDIADLDALAHLGRLLTTGVSDSELSTQDRSHRS
jgi:anion-transporting  ArsA/GET3 family ATPase